MVEREDPEKKKILGLLSTIPDPEIPVLSIEDLGVLRDVIVREDQIDVIITPTYSGCPAMKQIEDDIRALLQNNFSKAIRIITHYDPPWTTDWLTAEAKEKLRKYGIAPPAHTTQDKNVLLGIEKNIACPRCGSTDTRLISQFGSTACKALYQCNSCQEPFDYFKCI